jgi:hypothetical protein
MRYWFYNLVVRFGRMNIHDYSEGRWKGVECSVTVAVAFA